MKAEKTRSVPTASSLSPIAQSYQPRVTVKFKLSSAVHQLVWNQGFLSPYPAYPLGDPGMQCFRKAERSIRLKPDQGPILILTSIQHQQLTLQKPLKLSSHNSEIK